MKEARRRIDDYQKLEAEIVLDRLRDKGITDLD